MKHPIFNVDEYTGGRVDYTTPCPFGTLGKYTGETLMVGSLACQRCEHYRGINREDGFVFCGIK